MKLEAAADGSIIFNDGIDGAEGYAITVTGDESGTVAFNNKISNAAPLPRKTSPWRSAFRKTVRQTWPALT